MDGTGLMQLTNSPPNETHPAVVDSKIVYVSDESGSRDLWAMDLDGSNKQQLTSSAADECMPAWSPIGGIVYAKRSGGGDDYDLWAMNTDGTGKTQLTNNPSDESSPIFSQSPYQLKVAYALENDDSDIWTMSFKENDDKVRIWHLEGGYVLVCRTVYGDKAWLELAKNGTMVGGVLVAINESFSIGNPIITGTLQNMSVLDDSTFEMLCEVELVNVTQYSVDGGVLFSSGTKILTNALIRLDTKHGDLNFDGEISTADATIMLEIAVGNRPCDAATLATADMNGDGQVTSIDALMILQAAAR